MNNVKEYVKEHFNSLLKFDKTRIFDLIDIFQNTLITFFLTYNVTKFINTKFLEIKGITLDEYEEIVQNSSVEKTLLYLMIEFAMFTVLFFFLKKVVELIPPLPMLFDNNYKEHGEIDSVIELVMIVLLVEFSPTIKIKIERIYNSFF